MKDSLDKNQKGPAPKKGLNWLKSYTVDLLSESIRDVLKKIIVGSILILLGFFAKDIYKSWNSEKQEVIVYGAVIDENGWPVEGASIMAKGIEGQATSNMDGSFQYIIKTVETDSLIKFYCDKKGYETEINHRYFPKNTSPYGDEKKVIHLTFRLEAGIVSQILK